MTRALYLVGPPGVGKSSVTERLLSPWLLSTPKRLQGLLWGEWLVDGDGPFGVYLGQHRPTFSGTDALGMAVQPDAIRWVEDDVVPMCLDPYRDGSAQRVIGEGARLGNAAFLTVLAKHADLTVIYLSAPQEVLDERCERRGSTQSVSWRKGAGTRALRTAERCEEAGVRVVSVNGTAPLDLVVDTIRDVSGW